MIDFDIETKLRPFLNSDEKLVWTGKPQTGLKLRKTDASAIPFTFMWAGFAIFWEYSILKNGSPNLFTLWGVPFVAVGIYMAVGRFFVDAKKRSNTLYGITQNRIIILSGVFSQSLKSLNIAALPDVTVEQMGDGTGTIILGSLDANLSRRRASFYGGNDLVPSLEFIPDVMSVYNKIIELQKRA